MKTKIILSLVGCLLCVMITNVSFSQVPAENNDVNKTVAMSIKHERKIAGSENAATTNKKIQKSFNGNFVGATGQYWSLTGKNFHCSFYINDIPVSALFDKHGDLIYAITYDKDGDVPSDIRKIVKSEYFDYAITTAMEVKQNGRDIWIINMKEEPTHLTVRVENGEMEVVEQFKEPL